MEREDINRMLNLDVENNNTFSSFVDKTLTMMPPLTFSGEVEPSSSSSWYPESFHVHVPPPAPENDQIGEKGKNKEKEKRSRKVPRIAFHTRSDDDVLDDGYRWRKYGQKSVKNNAHPRSYYRCTYHTCNVKKQVQRLAKDPNVVVTTYEGIHNHPCEKLMETLNPLLKQLQFLSSFSNL
ncbi:PREDICTED: probable WRKY transcription factor 24 isoform X1 [Camelina sativa]|uniref:Probable WRKY transcription factor 24 isoform X1 n=1 Tax=Camelina sativa TaxID=90675 RepID=A0ABM0UX53_CAMSA|nr:PREDICTED: probable WRKY transcription factor 24 isoform X1 [Camelina sativa]